MSTENTNLYKIKSYNEIENLIENKKKELLNSYLDKLKNIFNKILTTQPLDYFFGEKISLPMPSTTENFNFLRFISDEDLDKLSDTLSNFFEPFIIKIKWSAYFECSKSFYSESKIIVGTINFNLDCINNSSTYLHILNKKVCQNYNWINDTIEKIFSENYSKMIDLLNENYNPKNFPKCLEKTQFYDSQFIYKNTNFMIYNMNNKDVTKNILNYVDKKVREIIYRHFPKIYKLEITENVESELNNGFLTNNNFIIKIKLNYCYKN